jgi:hypothetical protein
VPSHPLKETLVSLRLLAVALGVAALAATPARAALPCQKVYDPVNGVTYRICPPIG